MDSILEERAAQLDEMRRIRVVTNKEVDFEKWVNATDPSKDIRDVSVVLGELKESLMAGEPEVTQTMPWEIGRAHV